MNNERKPVYKQQSITALKQLLFNYRDDVYCTTTNRVCDTYSRSLANGIYSDCINQLLGKCNSKIKIAYVTHDDNYGILLGDDNHFYISKYAVLNPTSKTTITIFSELVYDAIIKVVKYYTIIKHYIETSKCVNADLLLIDYNRAVLYYNHVIKVINNICIEHDIKSECVWDDIFTKLFEGKYKTNELAIPLENSYISLNNTWVFIKHWDLKDVNKYKLSKTMKYELEVRMQYRFDIQKDNTTRFISFKRKCDKDKNFKFKYFNSCKINENKAFKTGKYDSDSYIKYCK